MVMFLSMKDYLTKMFISCIILYNIKSNEEFQRKGLNSLEISKIQRIFLGIPPSWKQFLNKNTHSNIDRELDMDIIMFEKV